MTALLALTDYAADALGLFLVTSLGWQDVPANGELNRPCRLPTVAYSTQPTV